MVEWYPHVLTVSTCTRSGRTKTLNMVEFYYPEEIVAFEREFVEAQQAAYMETCIEDDEIGERMDAGPRALMQRGDNEVGPYQSPMEDGMQHFHEWYRRTVLYFSVGATVAGAIGMLFMGTSAWVWPQALWLLPIGVLAAWANSA
jgi:choline monooxygenase